MAASVVAAIMVMTTTATRADSELATGHAPMGTDQAQSAPGSVQRAFDIPAQPLATALNAFGRQSGLQVSIDGAIARGVQASGVAGTMTAEQALQQLLAGTGITARFTADGSVTLARPGGGSSTIHLDPVQVQGNPVPPQAMIGNVPPPYAGGQVATGGQLGLLGNRGVMDTPFNQTSYTAKKAQDQQAQTVRDVLIDDPSVRSIYPDASAADDAVYIRGFVVSPDAYSYSGLYGMLPTFSVMAELAERIEVLKGPSVMLNGMPPSTAIGGTINVVPKRATDEPITQATASYASNAQFSGHADIGRRFGADKQFGVRFNGVLRGGSTPVEWVTDKRALGVLGLDYRGERVRLAADLGYQYQYIGGVLPYLGVAVGIPLPYAPRANQNPGQPWNYSERKDLFGVVRGEFDITERITAYAAFGAHDNRRAALAGSSRLTVQNFSGNATSSPYLQSVYTQYLTGEAGIRASVDTGPIGHELAFSATKFMRTDGLGVTNGTPFPTNIYNPNVVARPNLTQPASNKVSSLEQTSFALADTLSAADKRIQLTIGARYQQVKANNFSTVTGAQLTNYDQTAVSPGVAVVVRPWQNVSIYGNFIQGLQQGVVVGANFRNAGEVFPPYKSTQYEAGVKVDWGTFTTTASFFQITQPSTITDVPTNTLVLAGEQRNQGLEFNFFGEPVEGVRLLGGAMFLNGVLTKTAGDRTNGWTAPLTPAVQLNLATEWDTSFARGLTLIGRVVYTGMQYIDTTFPRRSLPDWTRFDVGARYTFDNVRSPTGKPVTIRFNVDNVFDTTYWAGGGGATSLILGAPRTFRLSTTFDF
jgi:iron complex outermembrane receptor protein